MNKNENIKKAVTDFAQKLFDQSSIFYGARRKEKDIGFNEFAPYEMELISYDCVKVSDIERILKEFLDND